MNTNILKNICDIPSPSNVEDKLIDYLAKKKFKYFTSKVSRANSISFYTDTKKSKTLLLDAHIDQVHLRILRIHKDGFIVVKSVGFGIETVIGNTVTHMDSGKIGIVGSLPPHLNIIDKPNQGRIGFVDFGLNKKESEKIFVPGDIILFEQNYTKIGKNRIISSGLDNKVSAYVLLNLIEFYNKPQNFKKLKYNLIVCFSSREEVGLGSFPQNFNKKIDTIIVMDSSPSTDQVGISNNLIGDICLGKGPIITRNYEDNRKLGDSLMTIAKKDKINHQVVFSSGYGSSNSNTYARLFDSIVQYIGIPIRYIHSPYEMIDFRDTEGAFKLMKKFLEI
jgi:tetrahedral aminopeptidase